MTAIPASPIGYNENNTSPTKFIDHLKFLLPPTIARKMKDTNELIEINTLESLGNRGLSWIPTLPRAVTLLEEASDNPKILLVAFSVFTLFSIHFMFYPIETLKTLKRTHDFFLDTIPAFKIVKFWSYVALTEISVSLTLRAAGRIYNKKLLDNFYKDNLK